MFTTFCPPIPLSSPPTLTELFANIIQSLLRGMHTRGLRPDENRPMEDAVLRLIYGRLQRLGKRFAALAAKVANGTLRPARPRGSRAGTPPTAALEPGAGSRAATRLRLPNRCRWLYSVARMEAAMVAGCLRALLSSPEMAALVAADPQRFGRILRPLCNALGISPTEGGLIALPAAPVRARAPRKSRALPRSYLPRPGFERAMPYPPPRRADAGGPGDLGGDGGHWSKTA